MIKENILNNQNRGEVIIYQTKGGQARLDVKLDKETIWLDARQMAQIFNVKRPAIVKHILNIYKGKELSKNSTCSILEQVTEDGKIRKINLYNLDMIISVGYRVNSTRATQFRIWATNVLKKHLIKGYTLNQKRLKEQAEKFQELQKAVLLIQEKSQSLLLDGQAQELLNIIADYSNSFNLLEQYDKDKLILQKNKKGKFVLTYKDALSVVEELKKDLLKKKQASDLFGKQNSEQFQSILGALYQTFAKKELYESLEEKAANLFYLTIKDHPFIDGNKRIASILFIYFLDKNNYLKKSNNECKINDNALVALALLIATSQAKEKDVLIKIITNLLKN
ncbi:type II toxin-antitoxin system death-on-curing family toxin [Candidatus Parcubacteria bacterium]|nr:type II toxin-antitoxin system death-on-curing family toxin [Candidatus Parcubacteria bacterium]